MTEVTKDCHCILGKPNSQVNRGEMGNLPIPHIVNSVVYLDFMHLPHYAGHNFALLVTCGLSRFARVFPMNKKADSKTVLKTLFEEWVQVYGLPKVIHSDQDVRLTAAGNGYRGVLETLGCKIQSGTAYVRTKTALCERQIRSCKTVMRILMAHERGMNWLRVLPYAIYLMNNQVSTRTGFSGLPGFHMEFPTPQDANPKMKEWMGKQAALASKTKELPERIRECENPRSNRGRKPIEYQIGDMVLVHHNRLPRWKKNDLDLPYHYPFMVTDVGPSSFKVPSSSRSGGEIEVGFPFLKRYTLMDEYDLDLEGFDDERAAEEDELNNDQDEEMTSELGSAGDSEGEGQLPDMNTKEMKAKGF